LKIDGLLSQSWSNWYGLQSRFAQALACRPTGSVESAQDLWASYRLGLYATVANAVATPPHWKASFARVVSLAACGRMADAAAAASVFMNEPGFSRHRVKLADDLAPFAPALALELLPKADVPPAFHAALLLRVGQPAQAADVLQKALAAGLAAKKPELHLLQCNTGPLPPQQQLARLNAFLAAYKLAPLALIDAASAPGPLNVRLASALPPKDGPLVSVLMTAYQAEDRIASAIGSLLQQTYRNLEVIVVDDASTDGTGQLVQALAAADARVKYLRLPRNVGTYVAKSIGLRHAQGEFVTCHDSDDWSHPLRLERQVQPLLDDHKLVITTSQWVRMQDDGTYYARPVHPLMRLNPASPLFRRELVLRKAGGWDPVRTGADGEFHARLKLVFGPKALKRLVQPLALGAHRPNSLMTANDTGYSAAGMSPTRLAYWEAWGHWHIDALRAGDKPYLPANMLEARRFAAPQTIQVPAEDIAVCLAACGAGL
jgi:hypothetical protein